MRHKEVDATTASKLDEYNMDDFKTAAKAAGSRVKDAALATAGSYVGQGHEATGRLNSRIMADTMMKGWLQYKGATGKPATADNVKAFLASNIQRQFGQNVISDAQLQSLVTGTPAQQVAASSPQQGQGQQQGQQSQQQQTGGGGQVSTQPQPQQTGQRPASSQPAVAPVNPGTGQANVAPTTYKQAQQQQANTAATASNVAPQKFNSQTPPTANAAAGGIPFMITGAMKTSLRSKGFTDDQISKMTPQQAQQNLQNGATPAKPPSAPITPAGNTTAGQGAAPTTFKQAQQQTTNAAATASNVAPQKFKPQTSPTVTPATRPALKATR